MKQQHLFNPQSLTINHAYVQKAPYFHQEKTLENVVNRLPEGYKNSVKKSFFDRFDDTSLYATKAILDKLKISLSDSDKRLKEIAEMRAEICQSMFYKKGIDHTLHYIRELGLEIPAGKTDYSKCLRLITFEWWERCIRKLQLRAQETLAREFGVVNKPNNLYVSNSAVRRVEARRYRSWQILKQLEAVNKDDDTERLNMYDVAQKSIANPENRHNELMVRAAGFDEYAKRNKHVADFYTVTCPSRFHAYHYSGHKNVKFSGETPKEAQEYLVNVWAKIRAKLKREKIQIYGLRIAEPHHDGTPHWHMLLYVKKVHRQQLRRIIRTYAMAENREELNTERKKRARYAVEAINYARGSGASYILKYIAKNIQGIKGSDAEDWESSGADTSETSKRVSVWASVWGIRQFQQIGGGSISVWRELRKLRDLNDVDTQGDMFDMWKAADSNLWDKFITLLGGADLPRSQQLAGLYKEINPPELVLDKGTGELVDIGLNKYGEEVEKVLGVTFPSGLLRTVEKRWRIEKMQGVEKSPLGVL